MVPREVGRDCLTILDIRCELVPLAVSQPCAQVVPRSSCSEGRSSASRSASLLGAALTVLSAGEALAADAASGCINNTARLIGSLLGGAIGGLPGAIIGSYIGEYIAGRLTEP